MNLLLAVFGLAACETAAVSLGAPPQIPENGHDVLSQMRLLTFVAANDPLADALIAFGDALPNTSWFKSVGEEYGVAAARPSMHVVGPAITANMENSSMQFYMLHALAENPDIPTDAQTLLMLYLPDGIVAIDDTSGVPNTGCLFYGGYHSMISAQSSPGPNLVGNAWAFAQTCGHGQPLSDLTSFGSHEIIEAATDPHTQPTTGYFYAPSSAPIEHQNLWAHRQNLTDGPLGSNEVADFCSPLVASEGGAFYAQVWSNRAAAAGRSPCGPQPMPFTASLIAPQAWYPIAAGQSIDIPLHARSRDLTSWYVELRGFVAGFEVAFPETEVGVPNIVLEVQDGQDVMLHASADPGQPSGTFMVIDLQATRTAAELPLPGQYAVPSGSDDSLVGIYVP